MTAMSAARLAAPMIKAVGMFSGGLDSLLAVKLIQAQGIEVDLLHYIIGFENLHLLRLAQKKPAEASRADVERQLGLTIQDIDVSREFLSVALQPPHGYGAEMNPCIDCKIFLLQQAKAYMEEHGAQFIVTGEVVGQRPMSQQRPTMMHIEKMAGLQGYLLRPLSAKLLPPTIPEQHGWVDREGLLGISGRGRQAQLVLAAAYHLSYQQPAGGCLLNDPDYAKRLRDLLRAKPAAAVTGDDTTLLKLGRHLRLSATLKIIIGRNEVDNHFLEPFLPGRWSVAVRDYPGPVVVIEGEPTPADDELIAQLVVSYTKARHAARAIVDFRRGDEQRTVSIVPEINLPRDQWRIG